MKLFKFADIKKAYTDEVIKKINKKYPIPIDPYSIHKWEFTVIEYFVWGEIRIHGLPFYPQYPIGKYFVDFADPVQKIVIEVDGLKYHRSSEQIRKDKRRQNEIESLGWEVIRIAGSETYQDNFGEIFIKKIGISLINRESGNV